MQLTFLRFMLLCFALVIKSHCALVYSVSLNSIFTAKTTCIVWKQKAKQDEYWICLSWYTALPSIYGPQMKKILLLSGSSHKYSMILFSKSLPSITISALSVYKHELRELKRGSLLIFAYITYKSVIKDRYLALSNNCTATGLFCSRSQVPLASFSQWSI